jgi:hypothetical protein
MKELVPLLPVWAASSMHATAQAPAPSGAFTLEQVLTYPVPDNLAASPKGPRTAGTFNERGLRNIFVGEGPEFQARRLTAYQHDDGQFREEIHEPRGRLESALTIRLSFSSPPAARYGPER